MFIGWSSTVNFIKKIVKINAEKRFGKKTYAQCGEDVIVDYLFEWLKIKNPSYLDIGAHHPTYLSNTYLFYQKGSKGVCVEPDPFLYSEIQKNRKRDICLNVGVGIEDKTKADFYIMSSRTLNTFSKKEAEFCQNSKNYGTQRIEKVIQIPLQSVNNIMQEHFSPWSNFVSLDVEGLDLEILQSFDFSRFQPEIFCIETLRFEPDGSLRKLSEIIDFMILKGYFVYADTYINTIFLNKETANRYLR